VGEYFQIMIEGRYGGSRTRGKKKKKKIICCIIFLLEG